MSDEKRVFEGELFPTRDKWKLAICEPTYGDHIVTIAFASREEAMKWAGKAVRCTIEPLPVAPEAFNPICPNGPLGHAEVSGGDGRCILCGVMLSKPAPGPGADDSNGGKI